MVITTATEPTAGGGEDAHSSWQLRFGRDGSLLSSEPVHRSRGTTVTLGELFSAFPVRRCELEKNRRREVARTVALLQAYALCLEGVRLVCVADKPDGHCEELLRSEGRTLRENAARLFGGDFVRTMKDVHFAAPSLEDSSAGAAQPASSGALVVDGLVSESTGRTANDRQFFFLNRRPVDLPRVAKCINSLFRSVLGQSKQAARWQPYPAFILCITADAADVDIHRAHQAVDPRSPEGQHTHRLLSLPARLVVVPVLVGSLLQQNKNTLGFGRLCTPRACSRGVFWCSGYFTVSVTFPECRETT